MRRREFLGLGLGLATSAAALAWSRLGRAADVLWAHTMRPQNWATPTEYFDRLITPAPVFFVRSHFGPPSLKPDRTLRVSGLVDTPLTLDAAGLKAFEEVTITSVLQCAGNGRALHEPRVAGVQWEHGAMGQAAWTGVRLADVLKKAGVQADARFVQLEGADRPPKPTVPRYVRGFPVERALDPTTLIAYRMNGAPLALEHGAPFRLVVPGWTGNHWIKWLAKIELRKDEPEGFYYATGYRLPKQPVQPGAAVAPADTRPVTTYPVKSIIGRPADGASAKAGRQEVVGVAFSGEAAIARVEVSLDGGKTWSEAKLDGESGAARWQVFRHAFDAAPGRYRAIARATDQAGQTQPEHAVWNPSGYLWNAWHAVSWTVIA
ncbi:MAG TPA: sulfite oxidase [Polyangia bacterium]|nr:sulfite oxidase [Polyangia bacterium]